MFLIRSIFFVLSDADAVFTIAKNLDSNNVSRDLSDSHKDR